MSMSRPRTAEWLGVALALVGAACSVLNAPHAFTSLGYGGWHLAPYAFVIALLLWAPKHSAAWLGAAFVMSFVDTWVFAEAALGVQSQFSMTLALLSALKLVVLAPIGAAAGALLRRFLRLWKSQSH